MITTRGTNWAWLFKYSLTPAESGFWLLVCFLTRSSVISQQPGLIRLAKTQVYKAIDVRFDYDDVLVHILALRGLKVEQKPVDEVVVMVYRALINAKIFKGLTKRLAVLQKVSSRPTTDAQVMGLSLTSDHAGGLPKGRGFSTSVEVPARLWKNLLAFATELPVDATLEGTSKFSIEVVVKFFRA